MHQGGRPLCMCTCLCVLLGGSRCEAMIWRAAVPDVPTAVISCICEAGWSRSLSCLWHLEALFARDLPSS